MFAYADLWKFHFSFSNFFAQTEISKRLNAIIVQIVPFLQGDHQQQVLTAVDRAKQITMSELNAVIGVSIYFFVGIFILCR